MFASKFSGVQRQLAAALTASVSIFIVGNLSAWPAPTLKKFREPDSLIRLTTYEEAWVVNALFVTMVFVPFPCGVLMNRFGRKTLILILSLLPALAWTLIYFSRTSSMLIVARMLAGCWLGASRTVIPIYVGEIAEPRVRGVVSTFLMINGFAGDIFVYLIGPYVSVPTMALISGMVPVIFFVIFSLFPESPYHYVMRGHQAAAAESLIWFREGVPTETVHQELHTIQASIERETKAGETYFRKMLNLMTVPANRKAFIIVEVMTFLHRFSGVTCMTAYFTVIVPKQVGPLTADHCTLILGLTWFIASLVCSALVDKVGRKPLLYVSSIGMSFTMIPTAIWYYLDQETSIDVTSYNWVPFTALFVHAITFSLGLGPIAPSLQGEMFPSNLKGQASALTTINVAGSSALSVAVFAVLNAHVGVYANFIVFATVPLLCLAFTYFCVVETKGKSLQMIQAELRGDWFQNEPTKIVQEKQNCEQVIGSNLHKKA